MKSKILLSALVTGLVVLSFSLSADSFGNKRKCCSKDNSQCVIITADDEPLVVPNQASIFWNPDIEEEPDCDDEEGSGEL